LILCCFSLIISTPVVGQDSSSQKFPGTLELPDDLKESQEEEKHKITNGVFHLELNISNSSRDNPINIVDFELNEHQIMKPGTKRTTGRYGDSHTIKLIDKRGRVIEERSFGLYRESIIDKRKLDGGRTGSIKKMFFDKHIFNFNFNYSAKSITIEEDGEQVFRMNIPKNLCYGEKISHYCNYNNFSNFEKPEFKQRLDNRKNNDAEKEWSKKCGLKNKTLEDGVQSGKIPGWDQAVLAFNLDKGENITIKIQTKNNTNFIFRKKGINLVNIERENIAYFGRYQTSSGYGGRNAAVVNAEAEETGILCYKLEPLTISENPGLIKNASVLTEKDIRQKIGNETEMRWKARVHRGREPEWLYRENSIINDTGYLWQEEENIVGRLPKLIVESIPFFSKLI
jgi:hypothetical protein